MHEPHLSVALNHPHIHLSTVSGMLDTVAPEGVRPGLKRKYEDEGEEEVPMQEEGTMEEGFHTKKHCSGSAAEEATYQGHDLNFPLPDEKGLPCLIKVSFSLYWFCIHILSTRRTKILTSSKLVLWCKQLVCCQLTLV